MRKLLRQLFGRSTKEPGRVFTVSSEHACIDAENMPCDKLNPLQSCFKQNYEPDRNCLVVSSTGTGKTILAYIAATEYLNEGKKVVMTAPTHELVKELYQSAGVGMFGRQIVGLYNGSERSVEGKYIIVTTPEGYLSALRGNKEWAVSASLMIVDEAHNILSTSRGPALDAAITLFTQGGGKTLLMSGTFPDANRLSEHLSADLFVSKYVRTKLSVHKVWAQDDLEAKAEPKNKPADMTVTDSGYAYMPGSSRLRKLKEILEQKKDESTLIFVPTKAQGFSLSHALDIPFHCADVEDEEKRRIVDGFRDGTIKSLIATTTLSQGVNTPADVVVVFGVRRGGYFLDSNDIRQMLGRAGRGKDTAEGYIIGDNIELFHANKEVYAKTLPLPSEAVILTLLARKNYSQKEICDVMLQTYAARLIGTRKTEEAVGRYLRFLRACNILKGDASGYSLTEEGSLIARYFLSPGDYVGYMKLARKLMKTEMDENYKGCLLVSALMSSLSGQGCPAKIEKDFLMKLIKLELDKDLDASRAGMIMHYINRPSAIPTFLLGNVKEVERWLGCLGDMEKFGVHKEAPGRKWLQETIKSLKESLFKKLNQRKPKPKEEASQPQQQLKLVAGAGGK